MFRWFLFKVLVRKKLLGHWLWDSCVGSVWIWNALCLVEGRGSSLCRPPTGNWDPPCEQRVHWRPCGCRPWNRHKLLSLWRQSCAVKVKRERGKKKVRKMYHTRKKHACCAILVSVIAHLPRDRKDSVYNRVLCVLCWLYVNISCKNKKKFTLGQTDRVKDTSRSTAQALVLTYIYTAFSQINLSSSERPLGYMTPERLRP